MKVEMMKTSLLVTALGVSSAACAGTASYRYAVLADNPLIYYEFDETSGSFAANSGSTGATNEAVHIGAIDVGVSSFNGGGTAYRFNRTNNNSGGYVFSDAVPSSLTEWTLEAWIQWDNAVDNQALGIFGNDQGGWNDDVLFGISPEGTAISPAGELGIIHQGAPGTTRDMVSTPVSPGEWYHVVATGSTTAGELSLYVNGVLVGTDSELVNGITLNGDGGIGTPHVTVGAVLPDFRPFDGLIDEFALYGTALSSEAVAAHYEAGVVPEPASIALLAIGGISMLRRRR